MVAVGIFTFKSFKEREAGKFISSNGELIEYTAGHILKFDEKLEDGDIRERKAKIELDDFDLIQKLSNFKPYQPITLKFKVNLYKDGNQGYLKLIDAIVPESNECEVQEDNKQQ